MLDTSYAPQVPPHGRGAAEEPNEHAEAHDGHRLFLREEGGVNQPAVDERVRAVRQRHRRQPAEHPLERALQQERAPHEAVGRSDQAHDGDLAAALQHRHADRRADDDDRHGGERRAHDEPHGGGDLAEPIELLHPVAPEPHVVHEAEATQPLGDVVHVVDVAEAGLELHLDRGGQRIALQLLQHVAKFDEFGAGALQRLVLAHVARRLHFGERLDVLLRQRNGFDRRAREQVGDDLHPLGHVPQRLLQVHGHEPEQAHHEQRERDRRDRQRRQEGGAAEREQRLADDEVHGLTASSRGSSTAESYISAPSWSSMTRYGAWRTRSRSWVAITTAVPLALMSRSSWNTPRVARSSRLPVGSSASNTVGSLTSARAIATRCCSPPDSARGYACALAARPTCVSTRITRAAIVDERALVTSSAKATFSSAVRSSSSRKSWKTIPSLRRSRGTSRGRISFTLYPETRTSPEVGRSSA